MQTKLKLSLGTVNKDLSYLREQARENIKKYVDEKIPEEYEKCLTGLNSILRESWSMSNTAVDKREKIEALKLARDCYSMRLDLLTNSSVINDSMKFIEKSKNKSKYLITKIIIHQIVIVTFKDLQKLIQQRTEQNITKSSEFDRFLNLPFWIWNQSEHRKKDLETKGLCCFNHVLGLPRNNNDPDRVNPLFSYQQTIYESLQNHKHLWILKSTGSRYFRILLKVYGMVMFER